MKFLGLFLLAIGLSSCAHNGADQKSMAISEKSKAIAAAYYEAYNGRSIDGQVSLMTDGFVYVSNSGKVREGKDAYRKYTEGLFAEVNEKVVDIKYFFDPQQSVVVAQSFAEGAYVTSAPGLPKAHGQKYRIPVVEIFELKDGQIARLTTVYNEDLWSQQIKAAELEKSAGSDKSPKKKK